MACFCGGDQKTVSPPKTEENHASIAERGERFIDVGEESDFFKSPTLNELRPFYNGDTLTERMAEIRKSIYYIRQHWGQFETWLASLKELMKKEDGGLDMKHPTLTSHAEKLLTRRRDWLTLEEGLTQDLSYEAIRLYTSSEGYSRIYRLSNLIFRRQGSVATTETIRLVVFLVELINIDLFNYCLKQPECANFEGLVYRGICLEDVDLQAFRSLRREPIRRRNIAVPLGLFSGSSRLEVARNFVRKQLAKLEDRNSMKPLLIKINVINLKPEYVDHYRKRFPSTVLTTICAVPIHDLSWYPDEWEVLLRGPFLQILDLYEDEGPEPGQCWDVLEAVMLNANRDHISTSFLGELDTLARDLFGTMVTVTRSEFAVRYCQEKGFIDDAQEYQLILDESITKLETLMMK